MPTMIVSKIADRWYREVVDLDQPDFTLEMRDYDTCLDEDDPRGEVDSTGMQFLPIPTVEW